MLLTKAGSASDFTTLLSTKNVKEPKKKNSKKLLSPTLEIPKA